MARRVAGLDIGGTSTKAVVVEHDALGVRLVASAQAPSRGVKGHAIVNLQEVAGAVARALGQATQAAGGGVDEVVCAVGGRHAQVVGTVGVTPVRSGVVGPRDLARVHASARDGLVGSQQAELHLLVHHYRVGSGSEVKSPLGMHGQRLEAWGRLVWAERTVLQNLSRCASLAGFEPGRFALGPLAAAQAVLLPEERDGSVCLIDVGGAATGFVAFVDGSPVHTGVVALGGDHLTYDLSDALRTPAGAAERLKREHGTAHETLASRDPVEVAGFGDGPARTVEQQVLCELLTPRVEELFGLVRRDLERAGAPVRPGFGFVLTGGGALLAGLELTAEEVLGSPVRRGAVHGVEGPAALLSDPRFAVALGLAVADDVTRLRHPPPMSERLRGWFAESFQ